MLSLQHKVPAGKLADHVQKSAEMN